MTIKTNYENYIERQGAKTCLNFDIINTQCFECVKNGTWQYCSGYNAAPKSDEPEQIKFVMPPEELAELNKEQTEKEEKQRKMSLDYYYRNRERILEKIRKKKMEAGNDKSN